MGERTVFCPEGCDELTIVVPPHPVAPAVNMRKTKSSLVLESRFSNGAPFEFNLFTKPFKLVFLWVQ